MGNSRSQACRPTKPFYLFYLIQRSWCIVADHRKESPRSTETDRDIDLSSRCSGCNRCDCRQDSLTFDSESEMAPNAEEELLVVKPWGPQPEKERLRPPTYNAEDYAIALRRWGRRPLGTVQDSQGTLPSTTSSSSGYASATGEMTLRQFTSVSELLNKLRADLRLAFPSFVQEFASPPADGITLLLETLRGVQLAQSSPPSSGHTGPRLGTRRAALDELGCVECLAACSERSADAPRLLVEAQPGLLALAVCLTSSLNRSRVLALQLLTKVCQAPGGHAAVSEAVSTLRLKYGEGGRFRFLAGALLAPRAALALRVAGVSFLNAFLKSAPRSQSRLYIQAEACEAGLEPQVLQEWLRELDGREEDPLTELLHKEIQKWAHNCIDVDALQKRAVRAEETCRILSKKVSSLQNQLQKLQLEKINGYNQQERKKMSAGELKGQKVSSNAEDEGISSSERSSSPEDTKHQRRIQKDNDQETTIDDVIEELRIIVKDAEEEFTEKNQEERLREITIEHTSSIISENYVDEKLASKQCRTDPKCSSVAQNREKAEQVTYFGTDRDCSSDSQATRRLSSGGSRRVSRSSAEGSVRIVVKGPDVEEAIVPAILHPQPPRRSPPCLSAIMAARHCELVDHEEETYNSHDDEIDEETLGDGSDSLLSASRLKYNGKNHCEERLIVDRSQKGARSDLITSSFNDRAGKTSKSLNDLRQFAESIGDDKSTTNEKKDTKTAMSYEGGQQIELYVSTKPSDSVYRQFNECQTAVHRSGTRYKSEMEKRKVLRRSGSHDYLESSASSPRSRRSPIGRVECRIRKFESLNSFDEHRSLRSSENLPRYQQQVSPVTDDVTRSRMRRSESFHHVSHVARKEQCSSRGGSDSGLFYVTDYNLEPLMPQRPRSIDPPKSPSLLTKSLDRIDEGLDSMVDIVITEEKWGPERYRKARKSRQDEKQVEKGENSKGRVSKKAEPRCRKNEAAGEQLRSDELYEEERNRPWNYRNEINSLRRATNNHGFDDTILSKLATRHNSFCQADTKFSNKANDTSIFAGRTYDTFGLGKSRFNASKYSGNHQAKENLLGRRNTTSSHLGQRGKVTDLLSGLY